MFSIKPLHSISENYKEHRIIHNIRDIVIPVYSHLETYAIRDSHFIII